MKDWARRIRRRSSHKKACVALARKLAVIMHRMMITGEAFRWPEGGERDAGGGLARSLTETSDHTDPRKRKRRPQPGRWPRRSRQFGCKPDRCPRVRVIPWEAEAKGHYDEASGPTAGNDFGDNRVPGKGQKAGSGGLDRETIRQPRVQEGLTERPELDNQGSAWASMPMTAFRWPLISKVPWRRCRTRA